MEKFAEYGFNKSHSAAYGLITIQTAWLKAHHPLQFMAALLTSEKDNTDKVVSYIAEARAAGQQVLAPDINHSELEFGVVEGRIRFGLGAIKGVGESAIEAILEARRSGPFSDLFDFCDRVDPRKVNRKVIEALVKAGAFDFQRRPRRQLFESIDIAIERGASSQRDRAVGQTSLLALLGNGSSAQAAERAAAAYENCEEWPEKERLAFEKEAMGFYVSGHPLHQYGQELARYARPAASIQQARREEKVTVAGIVSALRERPTKRGKRMAWVTLEDLTGSMAVVCFPAKEARFGGKDAGKSAARPGYENWEGLLRSDEPVLVTGSVQINQRDEGQPTPEIIAEEIQSLREVRNRRAKRLELRLHPEMVTEQRLSSLSSLLERHAGSTPVAIRFLLQGEAEAAIGKIPLSVAATDELLSSIDQLFGAKVTELA
jgi:DNA polymerase-3 subunit alpha